jgi:hypothetical protein
LFSEFRANIVQGVNEPDGRFGEISLKALYMSNEYQDIVFSVYENAFPEDISWPPSEGDIFLVLLKEERNRES